MKGFRTIGALVFPHHDTLDKFEVFFFRGDALDGAIAGRDERIVLDMESVDYDRSVESSSSDVVEEGRYSHAGGNVFRTLVKVAEDGTDKLISQSDPLRRA